MPSKYQPLAAEQYDLDPLVLETELSERVLNGAATPDVSHPSFSHRDSVSYRQRASLFPKLSLDYADIVARKRIWWDNAIINCLFIGTWWAPKQLRSDLV